MITISIKYFGIISSTIDKSEEQVEIENSATVTKLKSILTEKYPEIEKMKFKLAVNCEIAEDKLVLQNDDEVALLPPYAGG